MTLLTNQIDQLRCQSISFPIYLGPTVTSDRLCRACVLGETFRSSVRCQSFAPLYNLLSALCQPTSCPRSRL